MSAGTARPFRTFATLSIAQSLSLLGTGLTAYTLGVHFFERSGSAAQFGLFGLSATLPIVVLSPFAGVLVDRWTPRRAMALGQGAAGIATLLIATLAARQHVSVPLLCGLVCVTSACDAVAWTAFLAGMQGMVEPRQLGRANGLAQLGDAVSAVLAPIAATALLTRAPLSDVLVCDALTSFVASLAACAAAPKIEGAGWAARPSFVAELREVLDFLRPRTGLCALATIFMLGNFATATLQALALPLLLGSAGRNTAATVQSLAGLGVVAGGVWASLARGPARKGRATVAWTVLRGGVLAAGLVSSSAWTIGVISVFTAISLAPMMSASQCVWQRHVPSAMQGRVFAFRRMLASIAIPLAYTMMGPLADRVFEPAFAPDSPLAAAFGYGAGRGTAVLVGLVGAMTALVALRIGASRSMRDLDRGAEHLDAPAVDRQDFRHTTSPVETGP